MKTVEDLDVFKLAHQLALKIYSAWGIKLVGPPVSATYFDVSRILETWKFPLLVYLSLNF